MAFLNKAAFCAALSLLTAVVSVPVAAEVEAGPVYGVNILTGLFAGALVGAAAGTIGYARDRHNQDPTPIIMGAVYGSVGTAVGVGVPLAVYEVGADKPGIGSNALLDALAMSLIGGVVGGAAGTISYRNKVGQDDYAGEDFLAAAAAGVCGGAVVGLGVGIFEAAIQAPVGVKKPVGKGIHARLGILSPSPWLSDAGGMRFLPNTKLVEVIF